MRLGRIDLTRFGMFTDRGIDLPVASPDFHLIIGPNEAGKSTARVAISDLLFGVEMRSRFDFLHAYTEMRLGAVLEQNGERSEIVRLKRNKNSLLTASDEPLPDDFLAPFIGEADRTFFEQMFGLDHARLVEGGEAILSAKDDVAVTLFEASGGLEHVGEFRDQLDKEADSLWAPRKSGRRAYYSALAAYNAAERALKDATVRAKTWRDLNRDVEAADRALNEVRQQYDNLEQERARLERIRRVAPHVSLRRQKLSEREALGDVVQLPESAGEELEAAEREIAQADTKIVQNQALMDRAKATRDGIAIDEALLASEQEVEDLSAERHRVRGHLADIGKREAEVGVRRDRVEEIVSELGWNPAGDEELARAVPTKIQRDQIAGLIQRHGRLEESLSNAARAVEDKQVDFDRLVQEIESTSSAGAPPRLMDALRASRALGDVAERKQELEDEIAVGRRRQEELFELLAPWQGEPEALRTLNLKSEDDAREAQQALRNLGTHRSSAKEQIAETEAEINILELRSGQFERDRQIITSEVVDIARSARDAIWQSIRTEAKSVSDVADEYESKVGEADGLADQRFQGASDIKELEQVQNNLEEHRLKKQAQEDRLATIEGNQSRAIADWDESMTRLGLEGMSPAGYLAWLQRRRETLQHVEAVDRLLADFGALQSKEARAANDLREVLLAEGAKEDQVGGLSLDGLIGLAEQMAGQADAAKEHRAGFELQREQDEQQLATLKQRAASAVEKIDEWKSAWAAKLRDANLNEEIEVAGVESALSLMSELSEAIRWIREITQTRIETMRRDLDAFKAQADDLASRGAPDLQDRAPHEIAEALSERLRQAQSAQQARDRASGELENSEQARDAARKQREAAEATIRPLMKQAGVEMIDQLRNSIAQSNRLREIEEAMEAATREIIQGGDGLALEELETAVDAEQLDMISAKLAEVETQREEVGRQRDEYILRKQEAIGDRDKVAGQDDAARAEAQRQEALADMADATTRFLRTFIGARLLRWAIDRYREEKQGPLLARAGKIFTTLTLGSFEKLTVDFEGDTPQLMGLKSTGKHIGVDGMSDGTRDQLYLALRLAAIELYLGSSIALPFIADDLFIKFDADRAAAGFTVLGELAKQTQVIFLTHHDHLLPIARAVLGDGLNVLHL